MLSGRSQTTRRDTRVFSKGGWNSIQLLYAGYTFESELIGGDQLDSVSCALNHMWLTCLRLETVVLPWWAPQAQSTQKIPRTCDKIWPMSNRFGTRGLTHECIHSLSTRTNKSKGYELYKERDRQAERKPINRPVVRITHRVCWVETLLSILNNVIYRPQQQGNWCWKNWDCLCKNTIVFLFALAIWQKERGREKKEHVKACLKRCWTQALRKCTITLWG